MASSLVNEQTPLTDNQRDALESMHEAGRVTGVTSVYWELIGSMGDDAPSKDQISVWMRERPEIQKSRMAKRVDGKANSGGPIIPSSVVMSYVAAGTLFLPAAFHADKRVFLRLPFSTSVHLQNTCLCYHVICKTRIGRCRPLLRKGSRNSFREFVGLPMITISIR